MENKTFFAIAFVVLVLLCGCAQKLPDNNARLDQNAVVDQNIQSQDNNANQYLSPEQECNSKPTTVQRDLCLRNKAALSKANIGFCDKLAMLSRDDCLSRAGVALKEMDICSKISDSNIADSCYDSVAKDSNSYLACMKIVTVQLRANCLSTNGKSKNLADACKEIPLVSHELILLHDDCIRTVAVSKKDAALCDFISASIVLQQLNRDACYWSMVQSSKDKWICAKIFDKNTADNCVDFIAKSDSNANYCLNIIDMNKEIDCIKSIATSASNASYCLLISDKNESGNCKNSLLSKNTSISLCNSFPDAAQRENCLYEYAKNFDANKCQAAIDSNVSENCIAACQKIVVDKTIADYCYSDIAVKLNQPQYCARIRPTTYKKDTTTYQIDYCYATVAEATLDPSLCSNLIIRQNASKYGLCFANIAVKATDYSVCDLATKDFFGESYSSKNWCLYYYAKLRSTADDCSKIKDPNLLKQCIQDINSSS